MRRALFVLLLVTTSACGRCGGKTDGGDRGSSAEGPTVDGPESTAVVAGVNGHLVFTRSLGNIASIALPAKSETLLRKVDDAQRSVHALAGPDDKGRVAFVANDPAGHALKLIDIGGKNERALFARKGDPLWGHVIGDEIAIAPHGGNIAVLSNPKGEQVGGALLELGDIEVWNADTGQGGPIGIKAEQTGFAFSADGARLAYVALDPPEEAKKLPSAADAIGRFGKWTRVPVVHVVDLATKKDEPVGVGWRPVVAPDGASVLLSDGQSVLRRVELATKASTVVDVPGALGGGAVAQPSSTTIVYHGAPTKGAPTKTRGMSMGGTEVLHAIKVAKLGTREFATVADEISTHTRVSFGIVAAEGR